MSDPQAVAAEPVCPRHPERVSYVRCQRCDRPACVQCQRQAAVGVQCVDCVREQAKSVPQTRTVFGGRAVSGRPVVTQAVIVLCVLVYLAQQASSGQVTFRFAFLPVLAEAEPWRFLTAAFLHSPSNPLHILLNMFVLWQVGPSLEYLLGRLRFCLLYLVSALGGSVGYLVLADPLERTQWFAAVVGASGAVFGLFGALVIISRRLGRNDQAMLGTIAINFVLGFVIPNVAWQGHLGGLLTGAAMAGVLAYAPRERRAPVLAAGTVGLVAVLVALSLLKLSTAG